MIGALKSPRRRKYACRECTMRPVTVREAALRAWPSTWPPNTCGLPMSRLSPRNRLTSSVSSSSSPSKSAMRWSIYDLIGPAPATGRSAELECTLHDDVVPREGAHVTVVPTLRELGGGKGHAGALATADDLGRCNDVRISRRQIIVG